MARVGSVEGKRMLRRSSFFFWVGLTVGLGVWSGPHWGLAVEPLRGAGGAADQEIGETATKPEQEPSNTPANRSEKSGSVGPAPRELPAVRRAKRPRFEPRDWEGVYFENLFREGLVGDRPLPGALSPRGNLSSPGGAVAGGGQQVGGRVVGAAATTEAGVAGVWAKVLPGEAIENEVKRLQLQLEQDLTTPIKFKTDYLKVRQSFSLLSMWFAIIHEYDGEVRWKQASAVVQPACWRAAANARTDGEQAYQYARLRKDELQELVRGGSFGDSEKPIESVDWSQVVDRVPTMLQLDASLNSLKALTASKSEFEGGAEDVLQQSAVIAAIARVLAQEAMEGADDESYRGLAGEMESSAVQLLEAVKLNDFETAGGAVNRIEQSCNKCHEDWR